MRTMKMVPIVLAVITLALAGMAGAEQLSTGPKQMVVIEACPPTSMIDGDPLGALIEFNKDVTLEGWGTSWAGIIINGDGTVVNTFFAKGPYDFRYPEYTGYPSAASYQKWISQDDRSAIIFDSEGNVIDTMTTPTEELEKILAAEYALH